MTLPVTWAGEVDRMVKQGKKIMRVIKDSIKYSYRKKREEGGLYGESLLPRMIRDEEKKVS